MKKANPEFIQNLENDIISLRATITKLEERATLKYMPGWQTLRDEITAKLAVCELSLDNFQNLSDKGRDFILKERMDLKWFLSQVEDVETEIAGLQSKVAERQRVLNERNQEPAGSTNL